MDVFHQANNTNPSTQFSAPMFNLFDGTANPAEYVTHYHNFMLLLRIPEEKIEVIMSKIFTSSLKRWL